MDPNINLFHMAAVAPTLGYIGYQSMNEQLINPNFGIFLLIIALLLFVAHAYMWNEKQKKQPSSTSSASSASQPDESPDTPEVDEKL